MVIKVSFYNFHMHVIQKNLAKLNLRGNKISQVSPDVFLGEQPVKGLDLRENRLEKLPYEALDVIENSLEALHVEGE